MRPVIYDVAVSADGFICDHEHDISAFPATGDPVEAYLRRLAGHGTVITGRRSYGFGCACGLSPGARACPHMDHHIFSRSSALPETAEVQAVRDDRGAALARLRAVRGSGGAARPADPLARKRAPVLLGRGGRRSRG